MFDIKRSHLIAATAVPLAVVVFAAAIAVSRGPSSAPPKSDVDVADTTKKNDEAPETASKTKRASTGSTKSLAVSAGGFDRISRSLDKLGAGYHYDVIEDETLLDAAALRRFQAVFLTCADAGGEPSEDLAKVLREYVSNGGTLYTSDLRFDVVAAAFPELVDRASVAQGVPQDVRAEVISPELRDELGPEIMLHIKSDRWRPAAFKGDDVSVLLKGPLKTTAGPTIDAPLAVRFPLGKGTVIFTSFHSEGTVNDVEAKLLGFLAVKTVTSAPEARLTISLADAGLAVRAVSAVALDAGAALTYHDMELASSGHLSFRLEPVRAGAGLHLEVVDPQGKTTTKKGDKTLAIDLPDAAAGRWRYGATVESAPYRSFPAVIVVGSSGDSPDTKSAPSNPALVKAGNVRYEEINLGNKNAVKDSRPLRIAVTKPRFDDMGKLLDELGEGYRHKEIAETDLITPRALDRYDVLFLTCNGWPTAWAASTDGAGSRPGLGVGTMRQDYQEKIEQTLNRFVNRGGTLYVSDLRYEFLGYAFPDRIPPPDLDTKNLPAVVSAERNWLKVIAPLVEPWNVPRTLDGLKLSENLMAHRDELLAAIYTSDLFKPNSKASYDEDLKTVQTGMAIYGLPATALECESIARAFARRRSTISDSVQARKAKINQARREVVTATDALGELLNRLRIDYSGAKKQSVDAQVVDPGLQEAIGETIHLEFPANAWAPCRFRGQDVQTLIRGSYVSVRHEQIESPLLVKFRQGKGTVIFTSFHNEAQNSQQELQLLRYLVFSAVTAKEEALAQETMLSGGFSPVKQGQVNHAAGNDSITKKYVSEHGGRLRFSLNFGGSGATLRLTLVPPGGGTTYEKETDETLLVEATGAPPGEWLYTVTAVKVPYQNFAYSVSIGKVDPTAPESKR
jgi:hypothetical protein